VPKAHSDWPSLRDWAGLHLYEIVTDESREHPGERAKAWRLRGPEGYCYLKTYPGRTEWAGETYAYEHWARVFGEHAPRLLTVRDEEPLALIVSEISGQVLEGVRLADGPEREAWRRAGQALAALHALPCGDFFGRCGRDGTPIGPPISDAMQYLTAEFDDWTQRGIRAGCLGSDELAIVRDVRALVPAFEGERPTACHRDYCPANWLVDDAGAWTGVIDFEFAHWDVRAADFSRYPDWEWIERPHLPAALLEAYANVLTPPDEGQLLLVRALYSLGAIAWGTENAYQAFSAEGSRALRRVGELLG
jgi:aminoglycoside phosphotransferase (APT) family kinase protein